MAPSRTFIVMANGTETSFTSTLTDEEAVNMLKVLVQQGNITSTFARSLLTQANHLSPKQLAWVHKLTTNAKVAPPMYANIAKIFDHAGERLVRPMVTINIADMVILLKKLPSDHHLYPNQLYVYVDGKYNGRIDLRGQYISGTSCMDITHILSQLNADPQEYARRYGHTTGRCCFCNKKLTTDRSMQAGYGPVCAFNYNLAY